jgi:hypothetical protein
MTVPKCAGETGEDQESHDNLFESVSPKCKAKYVSSLRSENINILGTCL